MKLQTKSLTGPALNWAVAQAEGVTVYIVSHNAPMHTIRTVSRGSSENYRPSELWEQGGPIIEREGITLVRADDTYGRDERGFCNNVRIPVWAAATGPHGEQSQYEGESYEPQYEVSVDGTQEGPTPLIAAMRCYVASKLGAEIEVPAELTS